MKLKIFKIIWKNSEIIFNLVVVAIAVLYYAYGKSINAYTFGYEKIGQLVFGLAVYFIISTVNRLHFWAQFPSLYKYLDVSYNYKKWEDLPLLHRFWLAVCLYVGRLIAIAIVITAL